MIGIAPEWQPYIDAFREDAHQIIAWGYLGARPSVSGPTSEEDLTSRIADAIRHRYDFTDLDDRFYRYDVHHEPPIPGEDRFGRDRRRADIVIYMRVRGLKPRPRYVFEAKCLRKPTHPIRNYAGTSGMQRFLQSTSYSEFATLCAMLGYVQCDDPQQWAQKLDKHLSADPGGVLNVTKRLAPRSVPEGGPLDHVFVSEHRAANGTPVEVYHILLDCM